MQKIEKTKILSTVYKDWEENLEKSGQAHPKYTSSSGKYYTDIVMNLFYCQNGLCAYTEAVLCRDTDYFLPKNWADGRYIGERYKMGQLDHWNAALKCKKEDTEGRQDWLWDNFFMVKSEVNNLKLDKKADDILKPDTANYDPFLLLEYDTISHIYSANTENMTEEQAESINQTLKILGINSVDIVCKRRKILGLGINIFNEFPTAIAFLEKT